MSARFRRQRERIPPGAWKMNFLSPEKRASHRDSPDRIQNSSMPRVQENAPGIRPVALDLAGIADIDDHDVVAFAQP